MELVELFAQIEKPVDIRKASILQARNILSMKPVFVDTETTGVNKDAEVVDIAIVNYDGKTLLSTLVKPCLKMTLEAENIHHISDAMLSREKTMIERGREINRILGGRMIAGYNVTYDIRLIYQSISMAGATYYPAYLGAYDVMHLYASYKGDWQGASRGFRWYKLGIAAEQCNLKAPGELHRAYVDADLTRQILLHIAKQDV